MPLLIFDGKVIDNKCLGIIVIPILMELYGSNLTALYSQFSPFYFSSRLILNHKRTMNSLNGNHLDLLGV